MGRRPTTFTPAATSPPLRRTTLWPSGCRRMSWSSTPPAARKPLPEILTAWRTSSSPNSGAEFQLTSPPCTKNTIAQSNWEGDTAVLQQDSISSSLRMICCGKGFLALCPWKLPNCLSGIPAPIISRHALTNRKGQDLSLPCARKTASKHCRRRRRRLCSLLNMLLLAASAGMVAVYILALWQGGWQIQGLSVNPMVGPSGEALSRLGSKVSAKIADQNQWWRLVTSLFASSGRCCAACPDQAPRKSLRRFAGKFHRQDVVCLPQKGF